MSFVLQNICVDLLLLKYKILDKKDIKPLNKTSLTNILCTKKNPVMSYLDIAKNNHKCNFVFINTNKILNTDFKYHCYWCKHKIDHYPIGVPIDYIYNDKTKTYYSKRNNETYVIHEKTIEQDIEETNNIKLKKLSYYIVDGVCCSWNCAMSYIIDNEEKSRFEFSKELLFKMYKECNNINKEECIVIKPSPHWKMIDVFGGNWNIDEFRKKFNKYEYIDRGSFLLNTKQLGYLFEEKITF